MNLEGGNLFRLSDISEILARTSKSLNSQSGDESPHSK